MTNHEVIAFKSCFPASLIISTDMLNEYKQWYTDMLSFFDQHPEKLFVVMSTPPLHRLATDAASAKRARAFANWLKSAQYLGARRNVVCFGVFDLLAHPDDGSASANKLRWEYEGSHTSDDSHPNTAANRIVGPALADFLCESALAYER